MSQTHERPREPGEGVLATVRCECGRTYIVAAAEHGIVMVEQVDENVKHESSTPHERNETMETESLAGKLLCAIGLHRWSWHAGPDRPVKLTGVCSRPQCEAIKRVRSKD